MIVYIAGPYISDPEGNTKKALAVATELLDLGHTPFVPHLCHYWNQLHPRPEEVWLEYDITMLSFCDALIRLPGPSSGADREVEMAQKYSIPVYDSVKNFLEHREGFGGTA